MIKTTKALADAVVAARNSGAIGIDTEFVWERTYYPKLGLVQIGYPDGHCELVDAPAIDDWSPLQELLEDQQTIKILHDAHQDLMILKRLSGAMPANIFDTQRASGFIGLSSSVSLCELLKTMLGVRLSKSETCSNWLLRPLSEEQVNYAEDDVRYSVQLMHEILRRADEAGRRHWILEEMLHYENEAIYREFDPDTEMPRVRGSGALRNQQRYVLRSLGAWREKEARKRNLPRNYILPDEGIVSLIRKLPSSEKELKPCRGLTEKILNSSRTRIWKAIERGLNEDMPALSADQNKRINPDEGYESRVDLALALIKGTCIAAQLDHALIGNRADVTALVLDINQPDKSGHRILNGWRSKFIGNHLVDILGGRGSVFVNPQTRLPKFILS